MSYLQEREGAQDRLPLATVAVLVAIVHEGLAILGGDRGCDRDKHPDALELIDAKATEDGRVGSVRVKDSMLGDPGIESCMRGALV